MTLSFDEIDGKHPFSRRDRIDLCRDGYREVRNLVMTITETDMDDPPSLEMAISCLWSENGLDALPHNGSYLRRPVLSYAIERLVTDHDCDLYTLHRRYYASSCGHVHRCVMLSHPKFVRDLPVVMLINEPLWRYDVLLSASDGTEGVFELVELLLDRILRSETQFDPVEIIEKRRLDLD